MHETSLVDALFDQVDALRRPALPGAADPSPAAGAPPSTVRRIEVRIGQAAGVDPELFAAAFEALSGPRGYDQAHLALSSEAALWRCPACATEVAEADALFCPRCDIPAVLVRGEALVLERVELELEPEVPHV